MIFPKKVIFPLLLLCCLLPFINPALALLLGIGVSYFDCNGNKEATQRMSKKLLAWSIVGLGTTVDISAVLAESSSSFKLTLLSLAMTIGAGWITGRALGIPRELRALIAAGTAICGATAITAVGETIHAGKEEISLSLGVILMLNGIALFLFPFLGRMLQMSPHHFGVWAGLAIHDTSSVVGAALQFSYDSLQVATTVKLARALWIVPLTAFFSFLLKPKGAKLSVKFPWFIAGFVIAAALFSFIPALSPYGSFVGLIARKGFVVAIFLLASIINIPELKKLGVMPVVYGIILWVLSSLVSLFGIVVMS